MPERDPAIAQMRMTLVGRGIRFFAACLVLGAVVNDSLASVNQLVLPEFLKRAIDRVYHLLVKRKDHIFPRGAGAEGPQLELHVAPVLVDKLPDLSVELLAREVKPAFAFFVQFFFVDHPCLKASVVSTGDVGNVPTL